MEAQENNGTVSNQRNHTESDGAIERLKKYRDFLKRAGKIKEAQVVERCILIVKTSLALS